MDNLVKKWIVLLYNEAIEETTNARLNEKYWLKGCGSTAEQNTHEENIKRYEEYIEALEELRDGFILKNGG